MYQWVEATCTVSSPSAVVTFALEPLHGGIIDVNYYKLTKWPFSENEGKKRKREREREREREYNILQLCLFLRQTK